MMNINPEVKVIYGVGFQIIKDDVKQFKDVFGDLRDEFKEDLSHVSKIVWDESGAYAGDMVEDVKKRWESTTKDMKTLTAKSMWGTVSAWFEDDMDQVEDIWDNAWDSMLGKVDKALGGFLNSAAERIKSLPLNVKGPEENPGALSFRLAA